MANPSGTVNINKNGFALGTVTLDANGNGSLTYTATQAGTDNLVGAYGGDAGHNGSTGTATEQVNTLVVNTVTTLSPSPNPVTVGSQVTVGVNVSNA